MTFGYARISTDSQKLHLQIDALKKHGIFPCFSKFPCFSGKKTLTEHAGELIFGICVVFLAKII